MWGFTKKRIGSDSNAEEMSAHSFRAGVSQTSGTPTDQKNRQNAKKKADTSTVDRRSQSNQNQRKGKSKDSARITPSPGWITEHENTSANGSLKFGVICDREKGSIGICIDEYKRIGKQMKMYVKINICCDGKRIVNKKRKCKTLPVRGRKSFSYDKNLNITVKDGFENKFLLVTVWEHGVRHKPVSGILMDIDGSSNSPVKWQDLKSESEIKMAILTTAKPKTGLLMDGETDRSYQQSNIIPEQSPKFSSGNKADDNKIKEVDLKPKGLPNLGNTCYANSVLQETDRSYQQSNIIPEQSPKFSSGNKADDNKIKEVDLKPKGLPNLGNTCYANSVLQVLCQTPGFKKELGTHVQTSTAEYLLDVLYHKRNQSLQRLLNIIFDSDDSFRLGKQNDSHSFLLALFACIQEDTNNKACHLFEGSMLSRYTYSTCSHEEDTEQLFTSLVMPITEQKNLQGCIQEFCKEELYRRNLISCRSCSGECTMGKDKTVTTKRMLFATLPEILVFQMGRFEERKMSTSTKIQKKTTNITFAREIEMDEESSQSPKRYCLYGVVNHGGSIHGGHYTACVKVCGNTTETWYNCSDANVRVTSDPSCQSSEAAYLLFYHRVPRS